MSSHTSRSASELSAAERAFYSRQLILPEMGYEAQLALKRARVVVLGAGGLGAPALLYLAGAGVGQIVVVDDDVVDASNLHRQVIHTHARVGNSKADSAAESLRSLNPFIEVVPVRERLTEANVDDLLSGADLVLDGSDNFESRYMVSAAAARAGIAHVWAAILGFDAQLSVFWAGHGPVYEDLYPHAPAAGSVPSCSTAGVVGAMAGVVGAAMAMEAVKLLTGVGEPLMGEVGLYSALSGRWEYIPLVASVQAVPKKSVVLPQETSYKPKNYVTIRNISQDFTSSSTDSTPRPISAQDLKKLSSDENIALLDVREQVEFEAFAIDGAINLPLTELLEAGRNSVLKALIERKIPANAQKIVIYCTGYTRTVEAAREIAPLEDRPVRMLEGGISAWLTV